MKYMDPNLIPVTLVSVLFLAAWYHLYKAVYGIAVLKKWITPYSIPHTLEDYQNMRRCAMGSLLFIAVLLYLML